MCRAENQIDFCTAFCNIFEKEGKTLNSELMKSCVIGAYFTKVRTHLYKNKVQARKRRFMYRSKFYGTEESHEKIYQLLTSENPVMIARYGFTEINIMGRYLTGGVRQMGKLSL